MTNLINTEKALKHWLKNKVAVTTATVVGFLIMGAVSFGAITIGPNNPQNSTVEDNEIIINGEKDKPETWGKIEVTGNSGYRIEGIGISNNNSSIVNNGEISVSAEKREDPNNHTPLAAYGIYLFNSNKINVTNNGTIIATAKAGNADGISIFYDSNNFLKENSEIINNGTIIATAGNGASASAISVQGKIEKGFTLTITNTKNGILESILTDGDKAGERATVHINTSGEGEVVFTNEGTIRTTKGTAISTSSNSKVTNKGKIEVSKDSYVLNSKGGTFNNITNEGTIIVKGASKDFDINSLVTGNATIESLGIVKNDKDQVLENKNSVYLTGDLTTTDINTKGNALKSSVTLGKILTKITNEKNDEINLKSLNIIGPVDIVKIDKNNNNDVKIKNTTINFAESGVLRVGGKINVGNKSENVEATLSLTGNNVLQDENKVAVELLYDSTLNLTDVNFNGGIIEKEGTGNINVLGNTSINGELGVSKINIGANGKAVGSDKLTLASTSKFTKETILTNNTTGTTVFKIDKDGNNALRNSDKKVTIIGKIDFDTSELTKDNYGIELNAGPIYHDLSKVEYNDIKDQVYNITLDKYGNKLTLEYNQNLFTNTALNSINNIAQIVNDNFSQNVAEREIQLDKIYTQSIYTETVKAFYDTLKSTEHEVLSLNHDVKAGELKADGKALYSKNEYTKDGIVGSYDTKVETFGLLASLEYGVTDTMTTGVVFAGSKQDVDTDSGSADADIFYLGVYGNKTYGNYDLTAGLGYQFGKYEADNNIGNVATSDKYDTNAFTGYVQVKYIANLEDGLSIQPKVKLGYTYLKQDDTKDAYFGVSDAEVTTYDAEVGVDVVKSVQLEKSKLDITFGTSYVRTMGDTDEMFKGHFYGNNTTNQFNVLGAELAENVVKFNLGAEVANENGFFYNGGLTYEFGSNDTEAYGVNAGVGYKF